MKSSACLHTFCNTWEKRNIGYISLYILVLIGIIQSATEQGFEGIWKIFRSTFIVYWTASLIYDVIISGVVHYRTVLLKRQIVDW